MKKILILGDSFCYTENDVDHHWVNLLKKHFFIENCAQLGVGEYKIYQQFTGQLYDFVLIHHTSPYRIHTRINPFHNGARKNTDFLLSDVEFNSKNNREAKLIYDFICKYNDYDYNLIIWSLLVKELRKLKNSIHFTFFPKEEVHIIDNNLYDIFLKYRDINSLSHISNEGHNKTATIIKELIDRQQ